jgi:hypothetical protein
MFTSVEKERPCNQPEVYDNELYIQPVFGLKARRVYFQERIGEPLDDGSDKDY